jgi:hypothetical protein
MNLKTEMIPAIIITLIIVVAMILFTIAIFNILCFFLFEKSENNIKKVNLKNNKKAIITFILSILLFTIIMNIKYPNISRLVDFLGFLLYYSVPIWIIILIYNEIVERIKFFELLMINKLNLIFSFLIMFYIIVFPIEIDGQENDYNLSLILTATIWFSFMLMYNFFNRIKNINGKPE